MSASTADPRLIGTAAIVLDPTGPAESLPAGTLARLAGKRVTIGAVSRWEHDAVLVTSDDKLVTAWVPLNALQLLSDPLDDLSNFGDWG